MVILLLLVLSMTTILAVMIMYMVILLLQLLRNYHLIISNVYGDTLVTAVENDHLIGSNGNV